MKKFLILLVAIVGLTVKSFAQTTEFELDNWRIRVNSIQYETQVRGTFGIVKNANPDAIFVIVDLTVRNDENRGDAFYPQVWLKLLVAEKEIDGEDLGVY